MPSPSGKYNTHVRFSKPWRQGHTWYVYEYVRSRRSTKFGRESASRGGKAMKTYRYKMRLRRDRGGKRR